MKPDEVKLYEPGMAAHMMDVLGHDYRCEPVLYLGDRPMPSWPGRRSLVSALPLAFFRVQWQKDDEDRAMRASAAAFCGGLKLSDIMESDDYLK